MTTPTNDAPDFSAVKTADKASVIVGESITYTVVVTNNGGPGQATLEDQVPATIRVDSVTCQASTSGSCTAAHEGNEVTGDLSAPAAGTVTYTIKGTAVEAGSAKNLATVATTGPGCTVGPMGGGKAVSVTCPTTDAETPEIPIAEAPVFAITKTAEKTTYTTGETGRWTVTVSNTGKGAGSAWVTDAVPAGAVVTGITCTPVAPGTCDTSATKGQAVAATVVLPAGGSAVLVITATMRDAGTVVNTATVQAATPGCSTQCGGGSSAAPPVTVTSPPIPAAPLAFTGANVALMLGSALLLLVLGTALVLLRRRSTYRRTA